METDTEQDLADFTAWRARVRRDWCHCGLTDADLAEAWRLSMQHGPTHCWTGTVGGLARMVRLLLVELVMR